MGMERGERKTELMYLLIPKVIFGGKGGERESKAGELSQVQMSASAV